MPSLRDRLAAALAPRYVVDRELATGGMGVVFLGHDPGLGREVAIKVLPPERATAIAVERFVRESRLLARLAHPHIVPVLEAQQRADLFWFVMPLMSGSTLAARLASDGPMSEAKVRRLGVELLDALSHSHAQGVIHRDIKPANIFLQADHAMLADFGVAALRESSASEGLTTPGESVGTPGYMAPEQLAGGAATERSDQHALAATLYEAASGRKWRDIAGETQEAWDGVPVTLVSALRRALAQEPARRWPSTRAFAAALGVRRMRGRTRVLVGAAVAMMLAATWWLGGVTMSGAVPARGMADLAFEPFTGGGDSLGSEIPRSASFELERFPRISLVPWDPVQSRSKGGVTAVRVVSGRVERAENGNVELQVTIRERDGSLFATFPYRASGGDVVVWGAALADSIVHLLFRESLTEFRMLSKIHPSLPAMRRYFRGQDFFQRDQWPEAVLEFQAARALDSTLVLATWHELIALKWQRLPFEARLAELAQRATRLPVPMDRLIMLQMRPDLQARVRGLDSLVDEYPEYAVVRQIRDNELFHRGPLIGRSLRDGVQSMADGAARFALLDQPDTYAHTVWGALRLGDEKLAREQLRARRRVEPDDDRWGALLSLAVDSRFAPARAAVRRMLMRQFADDSAVASIAQAVRLGLQLDDPDDQLALGAIVATRALEARDRVTGESAQATAGLLRGRLGTSRGALHRAGLLIPADTGLRMQAAEWSLLLPAFGVDVPEVDRDAARRQLDAMTRLPRWGTRASWALALDATIRRDPVALERSRAQLASRAQADLTAASLIPLLQSLELGAAGNYREALVRSEPIHLDQSMAASLARGPFVRSVIYFNRGRWALALGDRAGADREWRWHENNDLRGWPSGEPQEGELDAALSAIVRLHRGRNLLAMGSSVEACGLLLRVRELWSDSDHGFATLSQELQQSDRECRTR